LPGSFCIITHVLWCDYLICQVLFVSSRSQYSAIAPTNNSVSGAIVKEINSGLDDRGGPVVKGLSTFICGWLASFGLITRAL
jgi:hypothetical protein